MPAARRGIPVEVVARRQQQQVQAALGRAGPDRAGQGQAVDVGQQHVEDGDLERLVVGCGRAEAAIASSAEATDTGCMSQAASCSSRISRLVALSSTTSTRRPRSRSGSASWVRRRRGLGAEERGGEAEGAALAGLAGHLDRPAERGDELLRDGQTEAGAAVLTGRRRVGLGESVEQAGLELAARSRRRCRSPRRPAPRTPRSPARAEPGSTPRPAR